MAGNPVEQNCILIEYELWDLIKKSRAIIMGTSVGAINMSAKWLCSKYTGFKVEISSIYHGIELDNFFVLSHFDLENNIEQIKVELYPLFKSKKLIH